MRTATTNSLIRMRDQRTTDRPPAYEPIPARDLKPGDVFAYDYQGRTTGMADWLICDRVEPYGWHILQIWTDGNRRPNLVHATCRVLRGTKPRPKLPSLAPIAERDARIVPQTFDARDSVLVDRRDLLQRIGQALAAFGHADDCATRKGNPGQFGCDCWRSFFDGVR